MNSFLTFVENLSLGQRIAWVAVCLGFSWLAEGLWPLLPTLKRTWRHAGVNTTFLLTTLAVNSGFALAAVGIAAATQRAGLGLFNLVELAPWLELLLALLALDFAAQYLAHVLLHRVGWLWRFHEVHHTDTAVDATTGARLHPGDFAAREGVALIVLGVMGMPLAYYLVYRLVTIFFTFFTHANLALPERLDRALSWIIVTPGFHKFHHHAELPWTDTNFGGILSIWDRWFNTLVYADPREIRYGLDGSVPGTADRLGYQMSLPFKNRSAREATDAGNHR